MTPKQQITEMRQLILQSMTAITQHQPATANWLLGEALGTLTDLTENWAEQEFLNLLTEATSRPVSRHEIF